MAIQLAQHPRGAQLADVVDRVLALTPEELQALSPYDGSRPDDLPDGLLAVLESLAREGAPESALDAVAGVWLGRPELAEHWDRVLSPLPAVLPETPYAEDLRVLLEDVTRKRSWGRVVDAHVARRGGLAWSTRMHEACRAAQEAGREREAARAQLAAARALSLSTAKGHPDFHAIAMAVTACVQALCTKDLIDGSALREAWLAGA